MAEFSQSMPQFQYPDLLGSYLRGVSAPGQLQAQQQGLAEGQLNIDQLHMTLRQQGMLQGAAQDLINSYRNGPPAG